VGRQRCDLLNFIAARARINQVKRFFVALNNRDGTLIFIENASEGRYHAFDETIIGDNKSLTKRAGSLAEKIISPKEYTGRQLVRCGEISHNVERTLRQLLARRLAFNHRI